MSCCMRVSMSMNGCWSVQILCHCHSIWHHTLVLMLHDEEHLFHPLKCGKIDSLRKLGLNVQFMQNKVWDIEVAMHEVNTVIKAKLVLDGIHYYGLHSQIWFFFTFIPLIFDLCIFYIIPTCSWNKISFWSGLITFSVMSERYASIT